MILTRAEIPYDIVARKWKKNGFRDSYAWHKRIWEAFPGKPDAKRDFLSRLDDTGECYRLLILSPEPPTRPDWCPSPNWESKTISEDFLGHTHYRFSLLANPTRKLTVTKDDGNRKKNGRREPLRKREDLIEWLKKKSVQHGFEVDLQTLKTLPRPRQNFSVIKKKITGTHSAVEYSGTLAVTDPVSFKEAVAKGIGPAKAFGFGMLCLHPITE